MLLFKSGLESLIGQGFDWVNDPIKALILTGYTYNPVHTFVSDVTSTELTGYTRPTIPSRVIVYNDTEDRVELRGGLATIPSVASGQIIRAAILFKQGVDDASSKLLAYQVGLNQLTNNGGIDLDLPPNDLTTDNYLMAFKRIP